MSILDKLKKKKKSSLPYKDFSTHRFSEKKIRDFFSEKKFSGNEGGNERGNEAVTRAVTRR